MAKADRMVTFIFPSPLFSLDTHLERQYKGGIILGGGGGEGQV